MSDTPTPETDQAAFVARKWLKAHECLDVVSVDVAEKLERERDELRAAVRMLKKAKGRHNTEQACFYLYKLLPEDES